MNRIFFSLFVSLMLSLNSDLFAFEKNSGHLNSDNSWRFEVGTSPTYIRNQFGFGFNYHEVTWNINASISYFERFWFGVQGLVIFTDKSYGANQRQNYTLMGVMLKYDILKKKKIEMSAEVSLNQGDYCTCGAIEPYRENQLSYLGLGGSIFLPVKKSRFNFETGFYAYNILNKIETRYVYTQYILGVNYRFGED